MSTSQKGFAPIFIILGLILIVAVVGGGFFLTRPNSNLQPVNPKFQSTDVVPNTQDKSAAQTFKKEMDKFIVANPLDLSQVKKISKFRSCAGHDFSSQNVSGVREENRSMKHYFKPIDSLASSIGEVKVFAPFNGQIKSVRDEREPRGKETILKSDTTSFDLTIFHLDLLPELKEGSKITAGKLIGYAHIASKGSDFDIAVTKFVGGDMPEITPEMQQKFMSLPPEEIEKMQLQFFGKIMMDSMFNYMTPDILSNFEKVGVTTKNIIIPKEERDLAPCTFNPSERTEDWIEFRK